MCLGCRIPLHTNWNIPLMKSLLTDYDDHMVTEFLQFGFPISYEEGVPDLWPNHANHGGATWFLDTINQYLKEEIQLGAMLGPFKIPPFLNRIGISPLSTKEKKGTMARRVIMDLLFLPGHSVNDYIDKKKYLGESIKVSYPTVDILAQRIAELGPACLLYKRDLLRYFRQILVCPCNYSLLGWRWVEHIFFDKNFPMGLTSVTFVAQRITNSICYIHQNMNYFSINYIDDFGSAEPKEKAWKSFSVLGSIFQQIGVKEAVKKAVLPTTRLVFLGAILNMVSMTIEIEPDRLAQIKVEL